MKKVLSAFLFYNICIYSVFADSFLTAQEFPKNFEDLSFKSRIEVLREGYAPYDIEYDENGVCISGCAYPGITIQEDMEIIDEATEQMAELIENENNKPQAVADSQTPPNNQTQPNKTNQLLKPEYSYAQIQHTATDWCHNGLSTRLPLRYPVDMTNFKYKITSDFGLRTSGPNGGNYLHGGLDIGTPKGTPVYATADGVVTVVANETKAGGAGLYINIQHDNGVITQYLHLSQQLVKKGDTVRACDKIALSGNSGNSKSGAPYGPHLDYRVRFKSDQSKFVDILCPCKAAKRISGAPGGYEGIQNCAHSLFQNMYKFSSSGVKRGNWRVKYGHCMKTTSDLLPDEAAR